MISASHEYSVANFTPKLSGIFLSLINLNYASLVKNGGLKTPTFLH